MKNAKAVAVYILALLVFTQLALAMDKKETAAMTKPKYKKVTGQVASLSKNSIVVKSKTKGDITLAISDTTDIVDGKAAKTGDKVTVNYRMDKSGKTATRIEVHSSAAKTPQAQAVRTTAAAPAKAVK